MPGEQKLLADNSGFHDLTLLMAVGSLRLQKYGTQVFLRGDDGQTRYQVTAV